MDVPCKDCADEFVRLAVALRAAELKGHREADYLDQLNKARGEILRQDGEIARLHAVLFVQKERHPEDFEGEADELSEKPG